MPMKLDMRPTWPLFIKIFFDAKDDVIFYFELGTSYTLDDDDYRASSYITISHDTLTKYQKAILPIYHLLIGIKIL